MAEKNTIDILVKAQTKQLEKGMDNAASSVSKNTDKISGAIDGLNDKFDSLSKGISIGFAAASAAAVAGIALITRSSANAVRELDNLARFAETTAENMDAMGRASETVGVQTDQLSDMLGEVKRGIGDFIKTGGGPMTDFFEQVAPKIGLTAEAMRDLSGPEALQAVKNAMDEAGVSMTEQRFILDSIASDADKLIPLLANNGEQFKILGDKAREAGVILDDFDRNKLRDVSKSARDLDLAIESVAKRMSVMFAPAIDFIQQSLTYLLNNAVKPLMFGMEALGVYVGVTVGIFGKFFDFISSPSAWNSAGIESLKNQVNSLSKLADDEFTSIAAKYVGIGGAEIKPGTIKRVAPYTLDKPKASSEKADKYKDMDAHAKAYYKHVEELRREEARRVEAHNSELAADARRAQSIIFSIDPIAKASHEWEKLMELQRKGMITMDQAGKAYEKMMEGMAADSSDNFDQIKSFVDGVGSNLEDTLMQAVTTGKLSFKSLADSIVQDLQRIIIKQSIIKPVTEFMTSAMSSGGSGFIGSVLGGIGKLILPSAAGGWDIPAGTSGLMKYHENEMMLPAKYADVIRNLANNGGGRGNNINIYKTENYAAPESQKTRDQMAVDMMYELKRSERNS